MVASMISLFGSRFVQGRTADSDQLATRALSLVGPDSELIGQARFHRRRIGAQPGAPPRDCAISDLPPSRPARLS